MTSNPANGDPAPAHAHHTASLRGEVDSAPQVDVRISTDPGGVPITISLNLVAR